MPRAISGMAGPTGFSLTVDREDRMERLIFERYRFERRTIPKDPLLSFWDNALEKVPLLRWIDPVRFSFFGAITLVSLLAFHYFSTLEITASQVDTPIAFGPLGAIFLLIGALIHLSGTASWHGLEHRTLTLLNHHFEHPGPADEESLYQRLKTTSPINPWCGSNDAISYLLLLAALTHLFPVPIAITLAFLPFAFAHPLSLRKGLSVFQWLFVGPAREKQLRFVARSLSQYLEASGPKGTGKA